MAEKTTAFDHPDARAATAGPGPHPDRISLRDHVVAADIGAFQSERGQEQRLRFNMAVELAPQPGGARDDVDAILSYDVLTGAVAGALAAERFDLLEALAERVAARILAEPAAERIFLRIEKLDRGPGALGVEIVRDKADVAQAGAGPAVAPVVRFVPADVADLPGEGAQVLVPALPALARPEAATALAARRIALLEIGQAAWAIASRSDRLTVVASRTEMDWALAQGLTVVWAPEKMVIDTPGAPEAVGDGMPLARWLADQLGAAGVIVHVSATAA